MHGLPSKNCSTSTTTENDTAVFLLGQPYGTVCDDRKHKHPLIKRAYEQLGVAKVQALKYHVGNIRRS